VEKSEKVIRRFGFLINKAVKNCLIFLLSISTYTQTTPKETSEKKVTSSSETEAYSPPPHLNSSLPSAPPPTPPSLSIDEQDQSAPNHEFLKVEVKQEVEFRAYEKCSSYQAPA
jgi:hypothetical protein